MLKNFFMERKSSQNFLALLNKEKKLWQIKFDKTESLCTQQLSVCFKLLLPLTDQSAENLNGYIQKIILKNYFNTKCWKLKPMKMCLKAKHVT